jgi:transposase InsO family protein
VPQARAQTPTFYKLKAKFGGMDVSEARCLRALEDENAKFKRLLADTLIDNVALKDLLGKKVTPTADREAAGYLQATYEMSQRRACRVIDTGRTSVRDQATRPDDGALRNRLKALAQERRRFGYHLDNCTRECLALVADTSLSGLRVARELDAIIGQRGRADTIVSDNGLN